MKLRNKVLITIGLAWALFLGLTYIGSRFFLVQNYLSIEETQLKRNLSRVDQSLQQISYALAIFSSDWAHWNEAYRFMQGTNPNFVKNNFTLPAFIDSFVNYIGYYQPNGKVLAEAIIDTKNKKLITKLPGLEKYIFPGSSLLSITNSNEDIHGYVLLNDQAMLINANVVTDGNKSQPALGVLITGRTLSSDLLKQISDQTRLNVTFLTLHEISKQPKLNAIFKNLINSSTTYSKEIINDEKVSGYMLIRDINDTPIGMLDISNERPIYQSGLHTINFYLTSFLIIGIVFSIIIIFLLRSIILKRLEHLEHDLASISTNRSFKNRVQVQGNDELSFVASKVNSMMDAIQSAHEKLEQRVEERTQELKNTNFKLEEEISERKTIEKQLILHKEHLVRLAHYDTLTALPNRIFFNEILNKALHHASRHNRILAVLFVDLDRFKKINDALGHLIGDQVLKEISERFTSVLRAGDVLARLGGDEFIILLADIEHPKLVSFVAEKILQACAKPIQINSHEFYISASIGICIYPNDGTSLEDLQRNADMAMYKVKRSGGNNYQYFTNEMNLQAHEHIQMEAALRKAINNNEFVLHFQPQINLEDGIITGVEALIRWEHPEHGIISPAKFIPFAEETGLIMKIGEWALREACRINKSWQDQGYQPITISVNISPKQFRHQDIHQVVSNVLADTGLAPKYLEIEITETTMMDDVETAINRLNAIKAMGVNISIDDFGTGYTSISYLKQFPVSVLKIDQHFIKGIPQNRNDTAITVAVIALAHSLELKVIAEGVETSEQIQFLAEHNCDMVQGYYISPPLPEAKIILQFAKLEMSGENSNMTSR